VADLGKRGIFVAVPLFHLLIVQPNPVTKTVAVTQGMKKHINSAKYMKILLCVV
jgi:hypothetical protein